MHRRGGMEGDEYPFLGLIRLSGVAISVCFDLAPNFPLFMHPLPSRVDPLSRIIFAMLVWQGCRLLHGPGHITAAGVQSIMLFLFVCHNSPPPHPPTPVVYSSLLKHLLAEGNQSQLPALTCTFLLSVALMSALLPGGRCIEHPVF